MRERLTRFRNFAPKQSSKLEFEEPEGRLYEYLEGVLLRGVGGRRELPRELAVYDLRKLGEWEDTAIEEVEQDGRAGNVDGGGEDEEVEETTESEAGKGIRTTKKVGFEIAEFAVDPGEDLLVLVEVR